MTVSKKENGSGYEVKPQSYRVCDMPAQLRPREEFERAYLEYQLNKHEGNVGQAAQEAEMERTHLYRKLKSLGIDVKQRK